MKTLILCMGFLIIANIALSHEGHGFKHAKGTVGPAVGGRQCSGFTQVWNIDSDDDGKTDKCISLIFAHDKLHVKQISMINGECKCP